MMDITKLDMEYLQQPVYSFHSIAWSCIADIDLNSEVFRCCGDIRFEIWGAWRVLSLLACRGNLELSNGYQV